ncbi:TLD domain-containing protein 2-like [Zingiber officinale]|uniref:TLD domain-containing protein 2-like n=1 Tax=Zingiber officinale TaxID=94328 RepID=UPI001C4A968D|nr:TLD domain-containing protein 2-like [Zingiber officinale]
MGYLPSLGSKAVHLVSDITTVLLNPLSADSSRSQTQSEEDLETINPEKEETEHKSEAPDGPDTSSFAAFLVSLLSSSNPSNHPTGDRNDHYAVAEEMASTSAPTESSGRKSLFTRVRRTLGKAINKAVKISGLSQISEPKVENRAAIEPELTRSNLTPVAVTRDDTSHFDLPDMSEPSMLLSDNMRAALYFSLPTLTKGSNWLLLYSTWRHGISLSTLYRRSALCPGYSLLVVGDKTGAVFGGLVEAPLQPTNQRKYQGTNSSFVFTDVSGNPVIFRTTGTNHYFTLCSSDSLALGGGGHFALYLDGDLLNGSSSSSDTFGNSCLAHSEEFEVKEIELWGFAYASKYDEMLDLCRTEKPGVLRW